MLAVGSNPGYPLGNDCGSGSDPCVWTPGDLFDIASVRSLGVTMDASGNPVFTDQNGLVDVLAVSVGNPGYPLGGACSPTCTWTDGQVFTIAGDTNDFPEGFNGDGLPALGTSLNQPRGRRDRRAEERDLRRHPERAAAGSGGPGSDPGYPLADSCGIGGHPRSTSRAPGPPARCSPLPAPGAPATTPTKTGSSATNANLNFPERRDDRRAGQPDLRRHRQQSRRDRGGLRRRTPGTRSVNTAAAADPRARGAQAISTASPATCRRLRVSAATRARPAAALLNAPQGVALDPSGNVFIADTSNARVREVTVGQGALPADAGSANGVDTTQTSPGSVTLSASGTWNNNGTDGSPDGNGGATTGSFLLPSAPAGALIGRIGTSGPWTLIGTGPTVINGAGELFLAMNDDPADFSNDSGSLIVGASAAETITSGYTPVGPIVAGATLSWQGDVTNDSSTPQTNVVLEATSGSPQENPPAWSVSDSEFGVLRTGSCVLEPDSRYSCGVGTVSPGDTAEVTTSYSTAGIEPQTMADDFEMTSDQAQPDPSHPALAASPPATLEIDGLEFAIPVPGSVSDGTPLTINGTLTDTSATQTINNITVSGSIDAGSFTSAPSGCQITNDVPLGSGASYTCPTPFTLLRRRRGSGQRDGRHHRARRPRHRLHRERELPRHRR